MRGKLHKVIHIAGGGMSHEVFKGAHLVVFDKLFTFNKARGCGRHCLPVLLKAKHGFLPSEVLEDYEPVRVKFVSSGAAQKLGMGSFHISF